MAYCIAIGSIGFYSSKFIRKSTQHNLGAKTKKMVTTERTGDDWSVVCVCVVYAHTMQLVSKMNRDRVNPY